MDPYALGLVGFILSIFGSRVVAERAFRELDDEQKVRLMDGFSGLRAWSMGPMLAILAAMLGLPMLMPARPLVGLYVGLGLLVVYTVAMHIYVVKKMRKLELDPSYQRQYLMSRHVSHLGLLLLFGGLLFSTL